MYGLVPLPPISSSPAKFSRTPAPHTSPSPPHAAGLHFSSVPTTPFHDSPSLHPNDSLSYALLHLRAAEGRPGLGPRGAAPRRQLGRAGRGGGEAASGACPPGGARCGGAAAGGPRPGGQQRGLLPAGVARSGRYAPGQGPVGKSGGAAGFLAP